MWSNNLRGLLRRSSIKNTSNKSRREHARKRSPRLCVEALEDRVTPTTYTVNTTSDASSTPPGTLSLRNALSTANSEIKNNPGISDTITFAANMAGKTIVLTQPTGYLEFGTANQGGSITVDATGVGVTVALPVGSVNQRVILVDSVPGFSATLKGLTIKGGSVTSGPGGGDILNLGNLTLQNCIVTNGKAITSVAGTPIHGGGIYNSGTLTLNNTVVSANQAGDLVTFVDANGTTNYTLLPGSGGGIYNIGSLTIQNNSTISGNIAYDIAGGTAGMGGGIFNSDNAGLGTPGIVSISGSAITGNVATNGGSGIFNTTSSTSGTANIHISNCSIANNAPPLVTIKVNNANQQVSLGGNLGGGIANVANGGTQIVAIDLSVITGNSVDTKTLSAGPQDTLVNAPAAQGGGIFNSAVMMVTNSTIDSNTVTNSMGLLATPSNTTTQGAGIFNSGFLTVSASTVSSNSAALPKAVPQLSTAQLMQFGGGGIFNQNALTVTNSTIYANSGGAAGGIYNFQTSGGSAPIAQLVVSSSTIAANTATLVAHTPGGSSASAGGINNAGSLQIYSSIVANNTATGGDAQGPDIFSNTASPGDSNVVEDISNSQLTDVASGSIGHPALLANFGNFGGPTKTIPVQFGSPAINNAGGATGLDQTFYNSQPVPQVGVGDTTIHVVSAGAIASSPPNIPGIPLGNFVIQIDNEQMLVTNVSLTQLANTLTVQRGYNGTTPAIHSVASAVLLAFDQAGNPRVPGLDTAGASTKVVDITLPVASITQKPAAFTSSTSASFSFAATDNSLTDDPSLANVPTFQVNLDNAGFVVATSPVNYPVLAPGVHTFVVKAIDLAGNVSTPVTYSWTVDTTNPTISITQKPANPVNSTSATFTFAGTDNVTQAAQLTFQTSLDGAGFVPAASPKNYTSLAAGSHTFRVRSVDQAGNQSTVAAYTWVIDVTAPTVNITGNPSNPSSTNSATFTFTGNDNVTPANQLTFMVSFDGGTFATMTSPANYFNLSAGNHTFQVQATDQAGNVSTTASYPWLVDLAAPTVTITQKPASIITVTSATFAFTGTDDTTPTNQLVYKVSLDGSAFSPATSPVNYTSLAAGTHNFQVEAIDLTGKISNPASYTFRVDLAAPTVSITQMPPLLTNQSLVTFSYTGTDDAASPNELNFLTSLDNGPFVPNTNSTNYSGLPSGSHTFQVESVDLVGRVSAPASYTWTLDVVAPTVELTQMPPALTNQTSATFAFDGKDNLSLPASLVFKAGLDGAPLAVATSPISYSSLALGSHTFQIEAIDDAGNISTVLSYVWVIDQTAPTVMITQALPPQTQSTSAVFAFIGSDDITLTDQLVYQTSLDGAPFTTTISPTPYDGIAEGPHVFKVQAIDQAGNVSDPAVYNWVIDRTLPTAIITQKPANPTNQTSATFAFTGTDNVTSPALLTFAVRLDTAAFAPATSPVLLSGLSAGSHTFQVQAIDQAGNVGPATSYTWTVQTSLPTASISQSPASFTNQTSATFGFTGSDPITPANQLVFQVSLDGSSFSTATSPVSFNSLTAGSHTFQVVAINQAGSTSAPASFTWNIDLTPPTASFTQTPPLQTQSSSAQFAFTGTDNLTPLAQLLFQTSLDGVPFTVTTSPVSFSTLGTGTHIFSVQAIDRAGNASAAATYTWSVDLTPPTASFTQKPANPTNQTFASFAFTGTDNASSAAQLTFMTSLDGAAFANATSPVFLPLLALGNHTYAVKAVDMAGNVGPVTSYSWLIEQSLPTASITQAPANPTNQTSATFTFTGTDSVTPSNQLTFKTSLDGAAFTPATSPLTYTSLAEGNHSFQVEAIDQAGNVSLPVSFLWLVDLTAPTSSVTALPSTGAAMQTVSWSGTDNAGGSGIATFSIFVSDNNGPFTPWLTNTAATSGIYPGQDKHTYSFFSVATDNAGNAETAPNTGDTSTTVDGVAPTSTVAPLPAYTKTAVNVSWAGSDNSGGSGLASFTIFVSDNGGAYAAWLTDTTSTSAIYSGLDGHTYGFYSLAKDLGGNVQAAPAQPQATTTFDTTAPTSSVNSLPPISVDDFVVSWAGSDVGGSGVATYTIYASDNGGAYAPWQTNTAKTSAIYSGQGNHTYSFYSVATDKAGNVQATPLSAQATTKALLETANQKYVEAVYINLLNRPVDLGGLKSWGLALDSKKVPRSALPTQILGSAEYFNNLVTSVYQKYLGRTPSPTEASGWVVQFLSKKLTDEQFHANVLALPEYIAVHGGAANATWVTSVYQMLLNRAPTASELNPKVTALAGGKTTAFQVALGVARSAEHEAILVRGYYQSYYGRVGTTAEVNGWVNAFLLSGFTNEYIQTVFTSTDLFYALHTV